MTQTPMNPLVRLAAPLAALVLSACAAMPGATPQEQVATRALERWKALLAGDLQKAYSYLSPASREAVPLERYRRSFGGAAAWKDAKIHSVTCDAPDRCVARVVVSFQPVMMGAKLPVLESPTDETWLLEAGQWWLPHKP